MSLNTTDKTAKRTMAELKAIELVSVEEVESQHGGYPEYQIKLVEKFRWFLSPEFKEIRIKSEQKNFTPLLVEDKIEGGYFSSIGNHMYCQTVLYNSILPRSFL
jgi:hypothetical protein